MGIYLNPGNDLFRQAVKSKIYVDKSMMICNTNSVLDTSDKHICISRPRRFGKSMAANMLAAYYDRKCDSRNLFENLAVSKTPDFETHLNKYDVIRLDISNFVSEKSDPMKTGDYITEDLIFELKKEYPELFICKSTDFFCEICHKEATKGDGLSFLQNLYGISKEETLTIGDHNNDIELLQSGGVKVAMGNATDELKAIADYVTDTVDNDGFAKAIEKFVK